MTMMNSINGFPVNMQFAPPPGVAPMDSSAFLTPQEKYLMTKGSGGAPAAGGVPGAGGGSAPTGGEGGLMAAIMKLLGSSGGGVPIPGMPIPM